MPKVSGSDSLAAWLEGKPCELAVTIAARAALRTVPRPASATNQFEARFEAESYLAMFRALAMANVAAQLSRSTAEAEAHKYHAAFLSAGRAAAAFPGPAADAARAAAHAIAAAHAAAHAHAIRNAAHDHAAWTADAVHAAVAAAGRAATYSANADHVWEAVERDLQLVEAQHVDGARSFARPVTLAAQPLWHGQVPGWADEFWDSLKKHLLSEDEGWKVWTDWYEDRLTGRPEPEALARARATIPDEDWNQGTAHVNAIIRRLIQEHTRKPTVPTDTTTSPELPEPRPAPLAFEFRDGALRKAPPPPAEVPDDRRRLTEQAWQALTTMLSDLIAADPGRNSPKLARVLDACRSALGGSFAALEIVALGVHAARLQGFAERADEFLMPEDAAELVALNAQLGLFLGQFPDWAEYARGLSEGFGSPQAETRAVEDGVAAIEAIEAVAPGIIAPDAKEELAALADAATPEPSAEGPGDVPPLARRSFLRSLRSGLLALSGNALSVVRTGVRKGAEKHVESPPPAPFQARRHTSSRWRRACRASSDGWQASSRT